MEIQHTANDFALTGAIREHAEDKLAKACARLEGLPGCRLHVTYSTVGHSRHGANQAVQVVVFVPRGEPLKAEEVSGDLYAAIDTAAKDIERQVTKYRDKRRELE